jgi:hypothetical protein
LGPRGSDTKLFPPPLEYGEDPPARQLEDRTQVRRGTSMVIWRIHMDYLKGDIERQEASYAHWGLRVRLGVKVAT